MGFDFDTVYERRGSNSLKWDFAKENHHAEDELPLWVADMDFRSPKPLSDAVSDVAKKGFFGYTQDKDEDREIVSGWLSRRHGYRPDPDWILFSPGVVFGLTMAMLSCTDEGDAVMISEPVYYPFFSLVLDNKRKLVRNVLISENGHYGIDFDLFEKQIKDNDVKIYILCSPHNPVGRVWTKEELVRIGDICIRNGVTVFSDEIHADFVYEDNKHIPFASISEEFERSSLTFTSPSKTFNMAGLQIAEMSVGDKALRNKIRRTMSGIGYAEIPVTGLAAMRAAYTECDDWVDALVSYIHGNIIFMEDFIRDELGMLGMTHPEGTYLPWVDCRGLGLERKELEDLVRNEAKLWLDAGYIFGDSGNGWQRFNAACPRKILEEALVRFNDAIKRLDN